MAVSGGLRIGELARLAGVTSRTIRHYEQEGLLRPPRRNASGYRLYPPTTLLEVAEIRRLRAVGLSVAEIASLRRTGDADQRVALIARLRDLEGSVDGEIEELTARRRALRELRQNLEQGEALLASGRALSFEKLEQALEAAGVSAIGIAEERRVWAALEDLDLPTPWIDAIDAGVQSMLDDSDLLSAFGEVLEAIAAVRHLQLDDPRVELVIVRVADVARRYQPADAVALLADPAGMSIVHAVASCFTPTQHHVLAMAAAQSMASSTDG
jgi:DNA-binding transcriptional MerR regulator